MSKPRERSLFDNTQDEPAKEVASMPGVAVREVRARSVLNAGGISDYSFNAYTGCTNGCVYCYARFMQRFHPHEEPWGAFVDVKINAPEVLKRQVLKMTPDDVFTCSACDGWQPLERHYELTRRCCEILLDAGFRLNVLTKSDLVRRDFDLFAGREVRLGVTITTADEAAARLWEPGASSVAERVAVLRDARACGLKTTVMFGPILPGISDTPEALAELFELARDADVDRIWADTLNARPLVWPAVQRLVRQWFPKLFVLYRRVLFDRAFRENYTRELDARIAAAAESAGLSSRLA